MPNLYEISSDYRRLLAEYNDVESDEEREAILGQLESIDQTFEDKVDNVHRFYKTVEAENNMWKAEEERFTTLRKQTTTRLDGLKRYLKTCLENAGLATPKITTSIGKLGIQKNGGKPSVDFTGDAKLLPKEFRVTVPVTYLPDTDALIERWKAREEWIENWQKANPDKSVWIYKNDGCMIPVSFSDDEREEALFLVRDINNDIYPAGVVLFPAEIMLPAGVTINRGTHLRIS